MEEEQEKSEFSEFKQKILNFTYELVSNEMNINFYLFLIVIENLQFLAYYDNGIMVFNTLGFQQFQAFGKFINLLIFLKQADINMFLVPLFFAFSIVHFVLLVIGYRAYQQRTERINKSISDRNFHKNKVEFFINIFTVCYTTVLTIPIFQTSVTAFYCSSSNPFTNTQQCYLGSHIVIAILGIINCVWLFVVNAYYAMYYFNRNPFSEGFMTCSSNWFNLGKFLIKIAPMIYILYDPIFEYPVLFLILMNVSYSGYLAFFSKFLFGFYRYNFRLEKIIIAIEFFVCLFNFHFVLIYVFQNQESSPSILMLAWAVMCLLLSLIVVNIAERMKKNLLKEVNSVEKKKLPEILEYLIYIINDTEKKFREDRGVFYVSNIALSHRQKCEDKKCYCQLYFKEQKKTGYHKNKAVFYTLLLAIIDRIIHNNKKAYPFFILKAYILFYKLESEIKAATTISEVMSDKLDFSDDMLVKGLLFELNEQYSDTRDMEIYRKFNEHLLQQEQESLTLTELYLTYWQELIDQKSSIPKLQLLLKKIKQSKINLENVVNGALNIFHNHVRVLLLYKNLLKEVANDYLGSIRCQERYKIGLKENKLSNVDTVNKIQFRQNENLLVINLTRNYSSHNENMGKYKIISISSNVKEFLGFNNNQLKNESINKLIPRIYHTVHDDFIDNILDRKNSDIESRQIRIFPYTAQGNIIQCNIISKFMPSMAHGINIVSFLEQCDKEKDQFFIIYNGSTGIVDSMTCQAELLLKDDSHRNSNSNALTIPDNITDLLPNWDYKQEVWRDKTKRGKSIKTIPQVGDCSLQVKHIELYRSDGTDTKFVKVLKFKGSYFTQMLSLDNESYQESNTIQKYLQHRRQASNQTNELEKLDSGSGQVEGVIHFDTNKVLDRDKERKKTANSLKKEQQKRVILIDEHPPEKLRFGLMGVQIFLIVGIIALIALQIVYTSSNVKKYYSDTDLLVNLNGIQSELSDSVYCMSAAIMQIAHHQPNITLPYHHAPESEVINIQGEIDHITKKYSQVSRMINELNVLLLDKIGENELSLDSITVSVSYKIGSNSSIFYSKAMTILQATEQSLTYGKDLLYRISHNESMKTVIPSPEYYFLLINKIETLPSKILSVKQILLNHILKQLDQGVNIYLTVKISIAAIILISGSALLIFYWYILKDFILKVLTMYEQITIDKIKEYRVKCKKYKLAVKGKDDKEKSSENYFDRTKSIEVGSEVNNNKSNLSLPVEGGQEESKLLPMPQKENEKEEQEQQQHFLSFQSKPNLKKVIVMLIVWISVYGLLILALSLTFQSQTSSMKESINTLNRYTLTENAIIELRFYTFQLMNMLGYWNSTEITRINNLLNKYFQQTVVLMNDTSLNFTDHRPFMAAKYHQFKQIQLLFLAANETLISQKIPALQQVYVQVDEFQEFLCQQAIFYQMLTRKVGENMAYHLNYSIILTILYLLVFWIFGIRYIYQRILEEHLITYEMYNIIGYNLRKEIELAK